MSTLDIQQLPDLDAGAWQASWDRQQSLHMPDREHRFETMLEVAEAVVGSVPLVLDLACGTGSITARLLDRLPAARSVAVDIDPVLLAIAHATVGADARVDIVRADLADPNWTAALPTARFDAVLTATALHWLPADVLRRVYGGLFGLLRPGGLVINADRMPDDDLPTVGTAIAEHKRTRHAAQVAVGMVDWDAWWDDLRERPELRHLVAERDRRFGGNHAESFTPSASWHVDTLRAVGFGEVGIVWRGGIDAAVAARKAGVATHHTEGEPIP